VVSHAMTHARHLAGRMNARHRIASYAVWEVAVLVLDVLAFALIGLQLRMVASRVHGDEWRTYALCAVVVCATVMLVRIVGHVLHRGDTLEEASFRHAVVVAESTAHQRRRNPRLLVRNARHRHARCGAGPARRFVRFSRSRRHRLLRVLCGAEHAGPPGIDASRVDAVARPARRRIGGA